MPVPQTKIIGRCSHQQGGDREEKRGRVPGRVPGRDHPWVFSLSLSLPPQRSCSSPHQIPTALEGSQEVGRGAEALWFLTQVFTPVVTGSFVEPTGHIPSLHPLPRLFMGRERGRGRR